MSSADSYAQPYKVRISRASAERRSRIILALDLEGESPSKLLGIGENLLDQTIEYLCAVKLGRQTVLNLGASRTRRLTRIVHSQGISCIIDDKIGDIGETNVAIADAYFRMGFDALTANPLTGWEGGLEPLFRTAHRTGNGIILLAHMSHPGASEGYGQKIIPKRVNKPHRQYEAFARKAVQWWADGVVVGATRPNIIREVKSIVRKKVPIYSPGVGTQGGQLEEAADAGTDYFIMGRSITRHNHPDKAAQKYAIESWPD